jgi:hypothetical protein
LSRTTILRRGTYDLHRSTRCSRTAGVVSCSPSAQRFDGAHGVSIRGNRHH